MQWNKNSLFKQRCWTNYTSICKKDSSTDLIPLTISNSKYIIDQNVKCKTLKLEDNIRENPDDLGYGYDLSDSAPKA